MTSKAKASSENKAINNLFFAPGKLSVPYSLNAFHYAARPKVTIRKLFAFIYHTSTQIIAQ
jgi:hypothetical protein